MSSICGIDVSGATLDARISQDGRQDGPSLQVTRDPDGIARLAAFCAEHGADLAVMEATGGYEKLAFAGLWEAGLACAIVNPRQVRRFAEAKGVLEKTDRLDAGLIAEYARVMGVRAQKPAGARQERLKACVVRLRQLTRLKVAQTHQRRLLEDEDAKASIDELLAVIRCQIKGFEAKITALLDADPLWRELDAALRAVAGVADRTVAGLMADLPEIGTLSGKAAAKLVGLAPMARDSGRRAGRRQVRGGRRELRGLLFVVAGVVARHDPDFAAFRQRLLDAGKPKKSVRVALARKLLVRLNAKARDVRKAHPAP